MPAAFATSDAPTTPDAVPDSSMPTQSRRPASAVIVPPIDVVSSSGALTPAVASSPETCFR